MSGPYECETWPKCSHPCLREGEVIVQADEVARLREALVELTSTLESITFHVGALGMRIEKDDSLRLADAHDKARAALRDGGECAWPGCTKPDSGPDHEMYPGRWHHPQRKEAS